MNTEKRKYHRSIKYPNRILGYNPTFEKREDLISITEDDLSPEERVKFGIDAPETERLTSPEGTIGDEVVLPEEEGLATSAPVVNTELTNGVEDGDND